MANLNLVSGHGKFQNPLSWTNVANQFFVSGHDKFNNGFKWPTRF